MKIVKLPVTSFTKNLLTGTYSYCKLKVLLYMESKLLLKLKYRFPSKELFYEKNNI